MLVLNPGALRHARLQQLKSAADLARASELTSATIARAENGARMRSATIRLILSGLGMSISEGMASGVLSILDQTTNAKPAKPEIRLASEKTGRRGRSVVAN